MEREDSKYVLKRAAKMPSAKSKSFRGICRGGQTKRSRRGRAKVAGASAEEAKRVNPKEGQRAKVAGACAEEAKKENPEEVR